MSRFGREIKAKGLIFLLFVALTFMAISFPFLSRPSEQSDPHDIYKFIQDSQKCNQRGGSFPKTIGVNSDCEGSTKWLNASCFSNATSLWFPNLNGVIDCAGFVSSTNDLNQNVSIVFIGDSRGRQLFASFAAFFHERNDSVLIKGSQKISPPLSHLKLPNQMAVGTLQQDFKTFGYFRKNLFFNLCFVWDPFLEKEENKLLAKINEVKPDVILVSVGVWYLVQHQKRNRFEFVLDKQISFLSGLQWKPKVIVYQPFESLKYFPKLFTVQDVIRIQEETKAILQNQSQAILFDSHLPLYKKYGELCHIYHWSSIDKSWNCQDANHMGFVVIDQSTRLILSYLSMPTTVH